MNEDQIKLLVECDQRSKSNTHRLDELSTRVDDYCEMISTIKVLENELGHIKDDVADIRKKVSELAAKPGKRWETVVEKVILLLVGGVVAFLLTRMGL